MGINNQSNVQGVQKIPIVKEGYSLQKDVKKKIAI